MFELRNIFLARTGFNSIYTGFCLKSFFIKDICFKIILYQLDCIIYVKFNLAIIVSNFLQGTNKMIILGMRLQICTQSPL